MSKNGSKLPDGLREALIANLSRHADDTVETFEGDRWLLAKIDIGALKCKGAFGVPNGPAFVMAGEPLLAGITYGAGGNRESEGQVLFDDLSNGAQASVEAATGAFCGAHYSPYEHQLTLVSDKLGLRPIYYLVTAEFVAFTSALRVFEAAGLASRGIDLRGTYEACTFGFPLGDRTCYAGIRTIGPAEIVRVSTEFETRLNYLRWDRLERTDVDESGVIRQLTDTFEQAIIRRLRGDTTTLSFLSGGLDSRTIVAALRRHNVDVYTVNFAPPGTQDRIFAAMAASALGSRHYQLEVPESTAADAYRQEHLKQWAESSGASRHPPERPRCVWSGDGGSVALGHVYLDDKAVDYFAKADTEAGIRAFLRYNRISGATRAMTRAFREQARDWHLQGVREEINALDKQTDGRALHLFLMLNDQRRHLANHFENIDVHRFEFHLPFFDSNFLQVIMSAPIRPLLRHALYHKWLLSLSPLAVSVPWQTYPNHEPCPVPFDNLLGYQWSDGYFGKTEERKFARKQGREALRRCFSGRFPAHLINRFAFATAITSCLLGSSSYSHVVRVGDTFVRYWQRCKPNSVFGISSSKSGT